MPGNIEYSDLQATSLTREEIEKRATMSPQEFRQMVRNRRWKPDPTLTQYYCQGYSQHSVAIVPMDYAFEFLVFCLRNPRCCYIADVCDPGTPHPPFLAPNADVRTDCQRYRVFEEGRVTDEPPDIRKYWRDDMVAFLLNCSMGFEGVLRERHVSYRTNGTHQSNIRCVPSGRFSCENIIVSTRIFPTSLDAVRAIQITSQLSVSHGYPIHIGDPEAIGIDLKNPKWNPSYPDTPELPGPGEIVMSWGCAVTPEVAIENAKPPIAITHYPGMVFISNRRTEEYHTSFTS